MKIHFIGIGGIGVSALAKYYLKKGHEVSGSDLVSSEIIEDLKKEGAKIFIGHRKENLSSNVDLVIYSPAVSKSNSELKEALKRKINVLSYPEALGKLTKEYFTIAVCGTHGKSTTTAMIGLILSKAKLDPTVIIGTKLREFKNSTPSTSSGSILSNAEGSNCRVGKSNYLVIEADEHFASFLNYWPKIIVLTTLEPDHLDYYKTFRNYKNAFLKFILHLSTPPKFRQENLPKDSILILNKDDKNIRLLYQKIKRKKIKFKIQTYSLKENEANEIKKILKIPGEFNVSNALSALKVARFLKIPDKISFKALSQYRGAWRRFEEKNLKIKNYKIKVIIDYGHHPTEIRETLKAAREKFAKKRIWCIFQPHQYQRTYYLWKDFIKVFKSVPVDKLIITDIYGVAGREKKEIQKKVSAQKLVFETNKENVIYIPKDKVNNFLIENLNNFEVVIFMGAGDIYNVAIDFLKENKTTIKINKNH